MRSLVVILLLVVFCPIIALSSQWQERFVAGDELKGRPNEYVYSYYHDKMRVNIWTPPIRNHISIQLITGKSFFSDDGQNVIVGFYKDKNTLVRKGTMALCRSDDSWENGLLVSGTISRMEFCNALCTTGMSIRIVTDRYDELDFDITIPADECFMTEKFNWIEVNKIRKEQQAKEERQNESKQLLCKELKDKIAKTESDIALKTKKLDELCAERIKVTKAIEVCKREGYQASLKRREKQGAELDKQIDELRTEIESDKEKLNVLKHTLELNV